MKFAKEVVDDAVKAPTYGLVREIAESTGIPYSSVWHQLRTDRKWVVEHWLAVLTHLGVARIQGDEIIIKSKLIRKNKGKFV